MLQSFRSGTRHLTVAVQRTAADRFTVTVDGQPREVEASLADSSTLRLIVDGVAHTARVVRVADGYRVAIGSEVYALVLDAAVSPSAAVLTALAPPQIVAPMPGKVLQVLVHVGQTVAAGDGLLILEAMKMEHRMVAEAPATVRALQVSAGQMVDAGTVLVELDYTPAE